MLTILGLRPPDPSAQFAGAVHWHVLVVPGLMITILLAVVVADVGAGVAFGSIIMSPPTM